MEVPQQSLTYRWGGNWDFNREEEDTEKQQPSTLWSRVLKAGSLPNAPRNSALLHKKQHLHYCFQAFSNRHATLRAETFQWVKEFLVL